MACPPQPGYPGAPYHPGQIDPAAKPNSATTIVAAVLSILGALFAILQTIGGFAAVQALPAWAVSLPVLAVLILACLAAGAVTAFLRKTAAWILMTAGSVCHIAWLVLYMLIGASEATRSGAVRDQEVKFMITGGVVAVLMFSIPAIATIVLSVIPPTRHYLSWQPGGGTYPVTGQYGPYGVPQGYGQPPQGPPSGGFAPPGAQQWDQQGQQWGQQGQQGFPPQQW